MEFWIGLVLYIVERVKLRRGNNETKKVLLHLIARRRYYDVVGKNIFKLDIPYLTILFLSIYVDAK